MKWRSLCSLVLGVSILLSSCGQPVIKAATPTQTSAPAATNLSLPKVDFAPLPAPAPLPTGTPEEIAASLAEQVRQPGATGLATLETALAATGFPLLDDQGNYIQIRGYAEAGLPLYAWNVHSIAAAANSNSGMMLSDLADMLSSMAGVSGQQQEWAALLQDGIRAGLASAAPSNRLWGELVVALGRQWPENADLVTGTDAQAIFIDGLQLQLILRRLANEMVLPKKTSALPLLRLAGAAMLFSFPPTRRHQADKPSLCETDTGHEVPVEEWTYDFLLDKLLEKLEHDWGSTTAGKYSTFKTAAAALVDIANLSILWSAVGINVKMAGKGPLIRTRTPIRGEMRTLTATLTYDTGDLADVVNCLRTTTVAMGLGKLEVPPNGPIKGASTEWNAGKGFKPPDPIVEFVNTGNMLDLRVNGEGKASLDVEGLGQARKLPEGSLPVQKKFSVRVVARLKTADFEGDLIDAADTARGLLTGDPLGPTIKFLTEMLKRQTLVAPAVTTTFDLTDWADGFRVDTLIQTSAFVPAGENGHMSAFNYGISFRLQGEKCLDKGGIWLWNLDIVDPMTDPWIGTFFVQINPDTLRGNWAGTGTEQVSGTPIAETFTMGGTAIFKDTNPPSLLLNVDQFTYAVGGAGQSHAGQNSGPASFTLPLEADPQINECQN